MTVEELEAAISSYKGSLVAKSGNHVVFSLDGPANMRVIDALLATIEAQEKRISDLEKLTGLAR